MNEILGFVAEAVLPPLFVGSLAALVLVPLALAIIKAVRVQTPVVRHVIWFYVLVGLIVIPGLWLYGPKLTLGVLPVQAAPLEPVVSPVPESSIGDPQADDRPVVRPVLPVYTVSPRQSLTWSWRTVFAGVWVIGFVVMLARLGLGWYRLRQICVSAVPAQLDCPVALAPGRPRIRLTTRLQGPVCLGLFRPTILLPADLVNQGPSENLRMVLAHELAHVRRRDCWVNLFQRFLEATYYFHPLVWLASRQLTQEREQICDNCVLAQGASPDRYTSLLLKMVEQAVDERRSVRVALFEGQLLSRIRSLLNPTRSRQTRLPWQAMVACTLIVLAVFLGFGSIRLTGQPATLAGSDVKAALPPTTLGQVKPPFTFTLKVTTPEGQPIQGVQVRCVHPRPERGEALVDLGARTDAGGSAQFTVRDANLIVDRYVWFDVADDGFAGNGGVGISPIDHEFTWTFKAWPVEPRTVRVVDAQGKGIPGARIWLGSEALSLGASPRTCDQDGNVTVRCPRAKVTVAVAAPGFAPAVLNDVEPAGTRPCVIRLNQGQVIQGRIMDGENRPVEGATIRARTQGAFPDLDEFIPKARSAGDGRFTIKNVSPGDWEVSARFEDPGRPLFITPAKVAVEARSATEVVSLEALPGCRIRGRYISQYNIRLKGQGGGRRIFVSVRRPVDTRWEEQTAEDGTFDIWGLPGGATGAINFVGISGYYQAIRVPQAYSFMSPSGHIIQFSDMQPGTYEGIEVHFLLAGRVEGMVVDEEGHPMQGVEVIVNPSGIILKVDEQGRYTGEAPPVDGVTLTVRRAREQQTLAARRTQEPALLVSESFAVSEGQIIQKNLVVGATAGTRPSGIGRPAHGLDTLGLATALDSLDGKRVLLCFFDMNQRPSRRLVQGLASRAKDLEADHVVAVAISVGDSDTKVVQQWLRDNNVPFTAGAVTCELSKLTNDWTVQALPWLVLLDGQHAIQATGFDLAQLDEALQGKGLDRLPMALDWRARFDLVYRLEDGQILKRIAPPFIPERLRYYAAEDKSQAAAIPRGPDRFVFHWKDGLKRWGLSFGDRGSLGSTLSFVLRLNSYEYEGPEELLKLELLGDWIIRDEAPAEVKLQALERLLASEIGRAIRFERRSVQQEVIVATGRYEYHPLPEPFKGGRVTMYSGEADPNSGGGGGTADSVGEFLQALGDRVGMRAMDQTESKGPTQIVYDHHPSSYLTRVTDPAEKAEKLKMLLDNVSRQTGLQFNVQKQTVQKWFVTEAATGGK